MCQFCVCFFADSNLSRSAIMFKSMVLQLLTTTVCLMLVTNWATHAQPFNGQFDYFTSCVVYTLVNLLNYIDLSTNFSSQLLFPRKLCICSQSYGRFNCGPLMLYPSMTRWNAFGYGPCGLPVVQGNALQVYSADRVSMRCEVSRSDLQLCSDAIVAVVACRRYRLH